MKLFELLMEASPEEIHQGYYKDISPEMYDDTIKADPTTIVRDGKAVKVGKYSRWLLKFVKNFELHPKELPDMKRMLTIFHKTVRGDIMSYKTLEDFNAAVHGADAKMDIVYDDADWQIETVEDFDSSCSIYGKKTDWCNARYQGNGRDTFNDYKGMGKAFIVRSKHKDSELYQVFFGDINAVDDMYNEGPDLRWEFQPAYKAKADTTPFFRKWLIDNPKLKQFFEGEGLTAEHKNIRTDAPEN